MKRQPDGATFPCARCGRPLTRSFDEHPPRIRCPRCRFLIYDYPRMCSGMVVVKGDTALLLRRGHPPKKGHVDIPGGFVDAGEGIDDAARRELKEETALTVGRIEQLGSYWDRYYIRGFGYFPTYNVYYLARWRSGVPRAGDDAARTEWVPIAQLGTPGARYAWRHMREMFADLKRRLRSRRRS